ncbi:two-component sensor histidine kinase [Leptolyngbyaceae cyanobacterium CCMR0082]|uniref:histidine kinase n=1 Tax=Adonisia turfae CCMR0082 TaxID=2304604 RepID=A0A6M0SHZ0_9CYAN|nr:two-component system sensor histidine kinase RppB [Adonisia turfae]NEZ67633.1 two-component sensor histidine kinase [Adonisia turfae CCMR0082]
MKTSISQQLFRRSRLRLALWYALVMGGILSLSGLVMYRALFQARWGALEREIESIAGTLHDSLEPMLPASATPATVLQQIFPDLCLANQPCDDSPTLIERHTMGVSDRTTYYVRLFDRRGQLLAFSPNQPQQPQDLNPAPWQTLQVENGPRYHQFTTVLHGAAHGHSGSNEVHTHASWGYLQIGRTLADFDAETQRIRWTLALGLPLTLGLVVVSSWGLSGVAMQPIYRSYQQQQQFTANAAHELRSPLASLLATVEATLRLSPAQLQEIPPRLQTIERQGRRLSQLIADLLLLTSLEQAASASSFKPCCLNDLITDLTEEYQELAMTANVDLTCQLPSDELYVSGQESQLYRLVANLIDNAIRHTPAYGVVAVDLTASDRTAIITVKDTGTGIPKTEQPRIFERFYRVDGGRDRKTGGTGLGLAIAQAIVSRHRGTLTVESVMGQGSLFTIHFSCLAAHGAH